MYHCFPESPVIVHLQHEASFATDYVLPIIVGQPTRGLYMRIGPGCRMLVDNGEAVYYDREPYRIVTCLCDLTACIVRTVTANVYYAAPRFEPACR